VIMGLEGSDHENEIYVSSLIFLSSALYYYMLHSLLRYSRVWLKTSLSLYRYVISHDSDDNRPYQKDLYFCIHLPWENINLLPSR